MIFGGLPEGIQLPGLNGDYHWIEFDESTMNLMMLMKVFMIILIFIQVRGGLKIVNPLIKEYRQAQNGATQGIAMTERKSKKMSKHINVVKGITCFMFAATIVVVPLTKTFLHQMTD